MNLRNVAFSLLCHQCFLYLNLASALKSKEEDAYEIEPVEWAPEIERRGGCENCEKVKYQIKHVPYPVIKYVPKYIVKKVQVVKKVPIIKKIHTVKNVPYPVEVVKYKTKFITKKVPVYKVKKIIKVKKVPYPVVTTKLKIKRIPYKVVKYKIKKKIKFVPKIKKIKHVHVHEVVLAKKKKKKKKKFKKKLKKMMKKKKMKKKLKKMMESMHTNTCEEEDWRRRRRRRRRSALMDDEDCIDGEDFRADESGYADVDGTLEDPEDEDDREGYSSNSHSYPPRRPYERRPVFVPDDEDYRRGRGRGRRRRPFFRG